MKIGFDYWQVISHYPDKIEFLMNAVKWHGAEVHVISAIGKGRIGTIVGDVQGHYPYFPAENVHEVVFNKAKESPELKLAKCKELGLDIFFDDRDDVCALLNANGILAMRVTRKDGSKYDLRSERGEKTQKSPRPEPNKTQPVNKAS